MTPVLLLQVFHDGEWRTIGWPADTEKSRHDLRVHGELLSAGGGRYRLGWAFGSAGPVDRVEYEYPEAEPGVTVPVALTVEQWHAVQGAITARMVDAWRFRAGTKPLLEAAQEAIDRAVITHEHPDEDIVPLPSTPAEMRT